MTTKNREKQFTPEKDDVSETQGLSDIITWSASCPDWQRDALRRLCNNGVCQQSCRLIFSSSH